MDTLDGRSLQQSLYTNDNWVKRRKLLFKLIGWKVVLTTVIIGVALFTRRDATLPLLTTLVSVAVPALLGAIAAETAAYVFGANADDKDKRDQMPKPTQAQAAAMTTEEFQSATPPAGWQQEN